jgi:hypothetical protein
MRFQAGEKGSRRAKLRKRFRPLRDSRRIDDVLLAIGEVWAQNPDLRLGQLLINAVRPDQQCPELFGIEDGDLVRLVKAVGEMWQREKKD